MRKSRIGTRSRRRMRKNRIGRKYGKEKIRVGIN